MQQVVEGMMSIFFLMLIIFTGIGIAGALTKASAAQNYKIEVIERLEDSNYDQSVIEACFVGAMERGMNMSLKLYYSDGAIRTFAENGTTEFKGSVITGGMVTITYLFEIPFLNISKPMQIVGSIA